MNEPGSAPGPASAEPVRPALSHRQILLVFSGLMLGILLSSLDQTIVATALPTIASDLGGLDHLAWVTTAYTLAMAISTPLYGKLGDLWGRKRLFQSAIVVFLAGSVLCGTAQSLEMLIAFRVIQGLGAGGLMSNAQAIVGDIVAPADRGRYQGLIGSVVALSTVAGPLLGGVLTEVLNWRWVFYVNLPLGALALVVTSIVLKLPPPQRTRKPLDWLGVCLLSSGTAALILFTSWGGTTYPWLSAPILLLAAAAAVLIVLFILAERRAADPLVPLTLFSENKVVRIAVPITFVAGCMTVGMATFLPLYEQVVRGKSPTVSGLLLAPMMLSMLVSSTFCGRMTSRLGRYKRFPIVGTVLIGAGLVILSQLKADSPYPHLLAGLIVLGLGTGTIGPITTLAVQNSVDQRQMGVATGLNSFSRSIGSSVGVAVLGAVFTHRLTAQLDGVSLGSSEPSSLSRAQVEALPAASQAGVLDAFTHAVCGVFLAALPFAVLGFVLSLMLKELPLRKRQSAEVKNQDDQAQDQTISESPTTKQPLSNTK